MEDKNEFPFELPKAFIDYVNAGKELSYEHYEGYVLEKEEHLKFYPIEELELEIYEFRSFDDFNNFEDGGEEEGGDGYYQIEYVCLIKYGFALVWLPQMKCFGQINSEDGMIFALEGVTWDKIVEDQKLYLGGLWGEAEPEIYNYVLSPSEEQFPFISE